MRMRLAVHYGCFRIVHDWHGNGHEQILAVVVTAAIVLQRMDYRTNRGHLTRSIDILPQFRIVGGQIGVAVYTAGQIQVAGLLGVGRRDAGAVAGCVYAAAAAVVVLADDRCGGENGFDFARCWIQNGGGALLLNGRRYVNLAELAALVNARCELSCKIFAR